MDYRISIEKNEIDQAIAYIKEGCIVDGWDENKHKKWLIDVYKQNGYEKDYEIEVRVYIASGASDAFDYYKIYRKEVGVSQWTKIREKILQSITDKNLLANCYCIEQMHSKLVELLDAKEIDFRYLQQFEESLLEYDNT